MSTRVVVTIVSVLGGTAVLLVVLAAAYVLGVFSGDKGERFATPARPLPSPSGAYIAAPEMGPEQNGVKTWVVVIRDRSGTEVFRDHYAYSTRHGVGITWLATADQLWILSGDVGTAHVDRLPDGTWEKTAITPETLDQVPQEIAQLQKG